jgi:predicted secreted protein
MAGLAGKDGSLVIGSDTMTEVQSWSLDVSTDMLEDTALGDEWKTNVAGLSEWSGSAEVSWLMSDTAQVAVQNAFLNKTTVTGKFYTNASNYYTGTAYIESMSISDPVGDLVTATLNFKGSGALTYA